MIRLNKKEAQVLHTTFIFLVGIVVVALNIIFGG